MTRINVSIPVKNLTDEHLLAEHREIKRLPSMYKKKDVSKMVVISEFKLGTGHVLFFLDKGYYTKKRYIDIYNECLRRGFNITNYSCNWLVYSEEHLRDWTPQEQDKALLIERISERIDTTPKQLHYCSQKITKEQAKQLLTQTN